MDISFLTSYLVRVIVGICLCVGYVLHDVVTSDKVNKFIPAIMAALGIVIAIWVNGTVTPDIALAGMFSGLASTGMYELFKQLISNTNAAKTE
jgi:hypothetical protein